MKNPPSSKSWGRYREQTGVRGGLQALAEMPLADRCSIQILAHPQEDALQAQKAAVVSSIVSQAQERRRCASRDHRVPPGGKEQAS